MEIVHELGGEIHVVLPFPPGEFRTASVDVAPGDWGARFDRLLEVASTVTIASDHRASGSVATFEYVNLLMTGLGQLRAELLDTTLLGLAVWDPEAGGAPGGSASVVEAWERRGIAVDKVHLRRCGPGRPRRTSPPARSRRLRPTQRAPQATRSRRCCSPTRSATAS